jgi:hypothetical protein
MRALAPEERILPISPENLPFSAACLAPEGWLKTAKTFPQGLKASSFCTIEIGTTEVVPFQSACNVWCVCPDAATPSQQAMAEGAAESAIPVSR